MTDVSCFKKGTECNDLMFRCCIHQMCVQTFFTIQEVMDSVVRVLKKIVAKHFVIDIFIT